MPKSAFYLFPRWAAISCIAVFVVFAGMGLRLVATQAFTEPTCDPKTNPGECNAGLLSAIFPTTQGFVEQTILTPLTIGGTTPRDLSLYGNLKMLSPNTSIIRSETLTGKAIDVGSLDNFTINASSSGSGKYALFANGVGSTGGVMAKTDSGKAIEAISTGTGLAALLQGAVEIRGETTIGTLANNANLNVYGDILVNGKLLAGSGSVVQKVKEANYHPANSSIEFTPDQLFGTGNKYTLTSFEAYSTDCGNATSGCAIGSNNKRWNPVGDPVPVTDIWYQECDAAGAPVLKLYVNNASNIPKNFRVVYSYTTNPAPCLVSSPAKAITGFTIPSQVGTTTINETDHTINLTMPFGTNVTALVPTITHTGASVSPVSGAAGDFTLPKIYTVTAADATTQTYTVTVTIAANSAKAITGFRFNALSPQVVGVVNETLKTVKLTVPNGTSVIALVPTITHTGASISPASGVAQNFTNPVTYTVTAVDNSTQAYTVTVTVGSSIICVPTCRKLQKCCPGEVGICDNFCAPSGAICPPCFL